MEKAPIVEALIAIDLGTPLSDEQMRNVEAAATAFHAQYPDSEPLRQVEFQVQMTVGKPPQQMAQHDAGFGKKYVSSDKRQLVVFRRNGFSFSRLPPYQQWGSFRSEAQRLWQIYRSVSATIPIVRFGLRYINRVSIPIGEPINQFLNLYPEVPDKHDGSSRTINAFYMRVDSILEGLGGYLIIQQAMLPPTEVGAAALSLDFDISFRTPQGVRETELWDKLESARHIKNEMFVDSLKTDFLETFR